MMHFKLFTVTGCMGLLLLGFGCKQAGNTGTQPSSPGSQAQNEQAVRNTDEQWAKTAGKHDLDGTVAFYTDDAVLLAPNEPRVTGKEAIRSAWAVLLSPNVSLTWKPGKVEVSQSGDLAYVVGTYDLSTKDAKGKPVSDRGKTLEVFRKQADGSWKAVADMYSSDIAAPQA